MRRNIHYKPSKSASILSGVIACAMGVFGLFTIPSIGAMIGFKAIWCLMAFGMFSFAVVRQLANRLFLFMRIIIKSKCYTNVRGAFDFDRKTG